MESIFISDKQAAERYSVNRTTVWRWLSLGVFPLPVKLSPGCTRWRLADLEKWEVEKVANNSN